MHTYFSLITKLRLNNVNSQVLLCYQAALRPTNGNVCNDMEFQNISLYTRKCTLKSFQLEYLVYCSFRLIIFAEELFGREVMDLTNVDLRTL